MATMLVRKNCEYSAVIEVDDDLVDASDRERDAINKANLLPLEEWDTSWSETTAEDEEAHDPIHRSDMPAGMRGED